MEAEYLALAEALRVASVRSSEREACTTYSDAKPLVKKMNGAEACRDDWQEYKASFDWLSGKFDEFELSYKSRNHNEDAHELAREALHDGRRQNKNH